MARVQSLSPLPAELQGRPHSPQPLSKRDKRRNMLSDKLIEMVASFSENRDSHYRAQVAAVQADLNLILKADPYSNKPLEDTGEEVADIVANITGGNVPAVPSPQGDFAAQSGRYYANFVDQVNDAMEERDIGLTMLHAKYEHSLSEIDRLHKYRSHLAREEHKALRNTLRERLIQQLTQKRARLMREKEQLDIADSNALLLHPNQFTNAHPASPGGPQNPRKTRNMRNRNGEVEDGNGQENRRKRKAATYEEENGSPGPAIRNIELGIGSPFRDAKAKTIYSQFEAPAYSIDRLFTDKELALSRNQAEHATLHFFRKPKTSDNRDTDGSANGVNGDHADDESATATMQEMEQDDDMSAPDMVRTGSYHATRGAARNALGDIENMTERLLRMPSSQGPFFLTPSFTAMINKPNAAAPTPPALLPDDVNADLALMTRDIEPDNPLLDRVLQNSITPLRAREYQYPVRPTDAQEATSNMRDTYSSLPAHMELGGVPMSAQSSMGGYSDAPPTTRVAPRRGIQLDVTSYTPERFINRQ